MIWPWSRFRRDALALARTQSDLLVIKARIRTTVESEQRWKKRYMKANDELNQLHPEVTELRKNLAVASVTLQTTQAALDSVRDDLALSKSDVKRLTEQLVTTASRSAAEMLIAQGADPFMEVPKDDSWLTPEANDLIDARAIEQAIDEARDG